MLNKENFFSNNADIAFHLDRRLNFDRMFEWLTTEEREALGCSNVAEFRQTITTILETLGEICGSVIAPNAPVVEKQDIVLKNGEVEFPKALQENLKALLEFGCASLGASPEYGGMALPFIIQAIANELIARSCPSTGLNICWYASIAHIVELFGSEQLKQMVVPRIVQGEWSGSMALTEADAGSDLAALRTYGVEQPDGSWRLYGSKRFISNGCGQVALVLAMGEKGATGLENLNLYLCLRKVDGRDNYLVTKIEEKIALHASATCELAFDGSEAYLLGERGQGFRHMLVLMNDARIAVGFQGLGLMEAVFRMTRDFASQRKTWGKPIAQHELIAEKLLDMEVELTATRSLCYQAAMYQSLMYLGERRLKEASLSDSERRDIEKELSSYRKKVRHLTPLIKWYVGEKSVEMARTGLQIHGGYGFTKEYRAEFWLRESLILPLYEGTSQIQALMCIKDTLKDVIRKPRQFIEHALGLKMQSLRTPDPLRKKLYRSRQLVNGAIMAILMRLLKTNVRASISENKDTDLLRMVKILSRDMVKMENVGPALLHAERLCEMKALVALADSLVKDALTDKSRRWQAERFLNKIGPRLQQLKSEIETDDPVIASRLNHEAENAATASA